MGCSPSRPTCLPKKRIPPGWPRSITSLIATAKTIGEEGVAELPPIPVQRGACGGLRCMRNRLKSDTFAFPSPAESELIPSWVAVVARNEKGAKKQLQQRRLDV